MNSNDILDMIGDAKGTYIWDAQVVRSGSVSSAKKRPSLKRMVLIAAIVALMLFLMGCAAVILLHLEKLQLSKEEYEANMQYQEDGTKVPATEKTKYFICLVGAEGSKNYEALLKWLEYCESYEPDPYSATEYQKPSVYCDYPIYNQEMEDFLKGLLKEYGLKPTGNAEIIQAYREYDEELFHQLLGIQDVVLSNSDITLDFGGCRFNECGNFNASYNAVFGEYEFMLAYNYHNKVYFGKEYFVVEDGGAVRQWNYTCQDGTEILIVNEKGEDTHFLCDREDAFISVSVRNVGPNWDSPGDVMTQQELQLIAESMDFTTKSQAVPDMESAAKRIAQSREAYENQDRNEASYAQEYNENENHTSYAELILCMRENETYFTDQKNSGYENFWDSMYYNLRDITGDGEEELILGKNGVIYAIWTIRDGLTRSLDSTYPEGYLCEGNVIEHYAFVDGQHFHHYLQPNNAGYSTKIINIEYRRAEGTWILDDSRDGSGWEEISEEKAMEMIGRYPRLELDMKPVKEYPLQ